MLHILQDLQANHSWQTTNRVIEQVRCTILKNICTVANMLESTRLIIKAIRAVPAGRVSSYRDIACAAGMPRGARQVARILHSLGEKEKLPWHRIVRAGGGIALPPGGGKELQIALLRAEGVQVSDAGRVDMGKWSVRP
jgi:methylated-DNA-protein-cysteine methyltransferase-like protein